MDRASFELIGNVGKLEIKPLKGDKKLAIVAAGQAQRAADFILNKQDTEQQ